MEEQEKESTQNNSWSKLLRLVREANQSGKPEDGQKVRDWAVANPPDVGVWRGLSTMIESSLCHLLSESQGTRAMIDIEIKAMRDAMGYDESSEIEKLMINRVMMCWLRVMQAEQAYTAVNKGGGMIAHIEFGQRSLMRANNQYARAVESLARVRVLAQRIGSEQRPKAKLALVK